MIPKHIKAVVFDAVGTLIHVDPSFEHIYAQTGRRFGSSLDEAIVRVRFRAAFAEQDRIDAAKNWITDEDRERQRWRDIVAAVFAEFDRNATDVCFEALFHRFGVPQAWRADVDAERVIREFAARGYRVALGSNFDRRLRDVVTVVPGYEIFETLQISSEIGWRKPSPRFFFQLAESLSLSPSQILFVGDDVANDYDPAIAVGMSARLIDPRRQHLTLGSDRIEGLADLLD